MGTFWSDEADELAQRARFDQSSPSWRASADRLVRMADQETLYELAAIGLTELVTQIHRLDRDKEATCYGDELAARRLAEWAGAEFEGPITP